MLSCASKTRRFVLSAELRRGSLSCSAIVLYCLKVT